MAEIIFRQEAIDDLNNIWEYTFEKWSESQADKYYLMLKLSCMEIGNNPEVGKEYDEINKNLFGLNSGRQIVFYQFMDTLEIEVIRILHEKMDLKISVVLPINTASG
jgi:toxin ParE1/3/4